MSQIEGDHHEAPPSPLSHDKPHRPADDSEEVYFDGSPLVRGALTKNMLWVAIGLLLIAGPLALRIWAPRAHIQTRYIAAVVGLGVIAICIPPLRAMTIKYRVTNYRIDYERGLIGKDIDTLELWHVEDINYKQTVMDRILGIGSITIMSHDITTPKLVMHSLPNSKHLFDQLKQRVIAVKRQRGVLKLDTGQ